MRLREINSPGELAVDPDLIDRFTSKGWQIDGEGQDQLVMSKPGSNTVLKIVGAGSQPRQAEIRRYVNFFRANQRDPHFPRVGADRELAWKGRKYYAYTQERLRPLSGDEAVMDYLEYAMGELGHDQEPDFERIPPGLSVEQVEGLTMAVDHMFQSGLGGQYGFDLSNLANIMQRTDGQLVITDPFSGFDDKLNEALVHRGQIRSQDPNDVWHVRDDATRKLRHHRGGVVLSQARPRIYQDDAKASYTYTLGARGQRRRSLPSFHWAYIQGRMVKGLPQDISQGRKLWFQRGQGFVYADSQEPFASADYVAFNPDGSVVAYDSGQPAAAAGPVVSVEPAQQTVAEGINDYLWHGSRNEHEVLYPQQANDTGGKEESNKNAVYATPSAKVAIAMGLTTPGSDTAMFPNDPQMVLFSGKIRKGQMVYLHKVPKDLFIKHNSREWYSKPGVQAVKPIEVVPVPVNKWLHLIRQATPQDLELQKKHMKKQGVAVEPAQQAVAEQRARSNKYQKGHHTMKTMREYIDLVGEAQPLTEARAQAPLPGSDAVYTVVFYNAGDETYKTIAKVRSPEKALQIIKSKFNEMYDTGDRLRKVAPNIYVLEPDYENTGERATADNYDHMYHWVIKAAAA